jgi:nicotinate-nucleotide adenylyltransferase
MKIGIYGGSFNPIHFGHIGIAQWVMKNTDIEEVWLMVSPNNPLKDSSILANEEDRLRNSKEAIRQLGENAKGIKVCDFEFHLPRPNYTANTLRELIKQYPSYDFSLIIGEDNLDIFAQWREYQYILENFNILVYPRKGSKRTMEEIINDLKVSNIKNIQMLQEAPYFDISSTELRKNLHI